jgi:hypothetical protein
MPRHTNMKVRTASSEVRDGERDRRRRRLAAKKSHPNRQVSKSNERKVAYV